jgi:hypothetical protein
MNEIMLRQLAEKVRWMAGFLFWLLEIYNHPTTAKQAH